MTELMQTWQNKADLFLIEEGRRLTYGEFHDAVISRVAEFKAHIPAHFSIALHAENSSSFYISFAAALCGGHPVLPLPHYHFDDLEFRRELCEETQTDFVFWSRDPAKIIVTGSRQHSLMASRGGAEPLFVVRTSGSSGHKHKYILHNAELFLRKYKIRGKHFEKTLAFSPADSIAGIETLLETLSTGGVLAVGGDRLRPVKVAEMISELDIDYFQTTPTFLNLMLVAKKLSSETLPALKKIAYGSEPISPSSAQGLLQVIGSVELMHTYGMSEIGIQITHTNPRDPSTFSLDSKNPGRLHEGFIELQSMTPMLGYLNLANPEVSGPWFQTGDQAREEEGYWRVLGRGGDLINIAGRKFFPSELENFLTEMPEVSDAMVTTADNDIMGKILIAKIVLQEGELEEGFRKKLKFFCEKRVPYFMHPHQVEIMTGDFSTNRFKKIRRQ